MPAYVDNVFNVATALKERMGSERQDQSLDLWKFNALECVLQRGRIVIVGWRSYLQRVEVREGF